MTWHTLLTVACAVIGCIVGQQIWERTRWGRITTSITRRDLAAAPIVYIDGFPARLVGYTTDGRESWTLEFMSDAVFRHSYTKGD
jgi:hypothetical protein